MNELQLNAIALLTSIKELANEGISKVLAGEELPTEWELLESIKRDVQELEEELSND